MLERVKVSPSESDIEDRYPVLSFTWFSILSLLSLINAEEFGITNKDLMTPKIYSAPNISINQVSLA
jgi:hypothetical protein